jgi:hypothetical protein
MYINQKLNGVFPEYSDMPCECDEDMIPDDIGQDSKFPPLRRSTIASDLVAVSIGTGTINVSRRNLKMYTNYFEEGNALITQSLQNYNNVSPRSLTIIEDLLNFATFPYSIGRPDICPDDLIIVLDVCEILQFQMSLDVGKSWSDINRESNKIYEFITCDNSLLKPNVLLILPPIIV